MLGHRSLIKNFTRENEGSSNFLGHSLCFFHQEDPAVDTRIHVSAITMLGFSHHLQVFQARVHSLKLHAKLLGSLNRSTPAFLAQTERTCHVESNNVDSLLKNQFCGK